MSVTFRPKKNENELYFEISNVSPSFINGLRRIALSELVTVGFNTEDYINSDLKVIKNTGALHNEFILHRISMIPIYYKDISLFDVNKYKFVLKKENNTNSVMNVTSGDIEVFDNDTGKKLTSSEFFPAVNNSYILITKLKPNPNKQGEELHIEGKSSKFSGKKNAHYQPVCCFTYSNKQDPEKTDRELKKYLKENKDKDSEKMLEKIFETSIAERHFYTDVNGVCNHFNGYIESIGVLTPEQIFSECLDILLVKIKTFKTGVNNVTSNELSDRIELSLSLDNMKAYEIKVYDETHTLGNIIQSYANILFDTTKLIFLGYKNPHPLENNIIFKIRTNTNSLEEINEIISATCDTVIEIAETIKKQTDKS